MPKLLFSNTVQVQKILETRDVDEAPTHRPHLTTTLLELPEFIEDFRMISIETQVMDAWGGVQIIKVGLLATFDQIRTHGIHVWYMYLHLP